MPYDYTSWDQPQDPDEQLRQFREMMAAQQANSNPGFGPGPAVDPMAQIGPEARFGGLLGASLAQTDPSQPVAPARSGANALYGGGNVNYGEILDQIVGKTGLGRSILMGKTKSL